TPLPGGRTRLQGTTWYRHRMWPAGYWRLWCDAVVHRIHLAGAAAHQAARGSLVAPELLPPLLFVERGDAHAAPDVFDAPAGERGEGLRLVLLPAGQLLPVLVHGGAAFRLLPRVAQHVARLEVLAVAGLLEGQV